MQAELVEGLIFHYNQQKVIYNKHYFRTGILGFVLKIGYALRDCRVVQIKDYTRSLSCWNEFVIFTYEQENFENMNLGGRPRYRCITDEDINIINKLQNDYTEVQEIKDYYSYWSIPVTDFF